MQSFGPNSSSICLFKTINRSAPDQTNFSGFANSYGIAFKIFSLFSFSTMASVYKPAPHLSATFCQAFCLDLPRNTSSFTTSAKGLIASVPALCYVAGLRTNLPQTLAVMSKLRFFPRVDELQQYSVRGRLVDVGSHYHLEPANTPLSLSTNRRVGWATNLYVLVRHTLLNIASFYAGIVAGPALRDALREGINHDTVVNQPTESPVGCITNAISDALPSTASLPRTLETVTEITTSFSQNVCNLFSGLYSSTTTAFKNACTRIDDYPSALP